MPVAAPASPRRASRWVKWLLIVLALTAAATFMWQQLPGAAYPTDLTRVGAGRPTLVLAHDSNFTGSTAVMALMKDLRADYADRVDFLVAHLSMPDARAFVARHGAQDGTVLLFSGDGRRVDVLHQPRTGEELRRALDQAFGR